MTAAASGPRVGKGTPGTLLTGFGLERASTFVGRRIWGDWIRLHAAPDSGRVGYEGRV